MASTPTGTGHAGAALALDFVLAATGGDRVARGSSGAGRRSFSGVAIDGRAVPRGGLFVAIRGERFDGHDFAAQAVAHGAAGVLATRERAGDLARLAGLAADVIAVDDTVRALGALGRAHRDALGEQGGLRVVGITGSNGKTTTKELVAAILAAHAGDAAVHKTGGNLNNHLGVPLTLLGLTAAHRYAVVEMGMSALGEIAYLASLARPDVGAIVNVGPVHLETLGTVENVARAKGELFAALAPAAACVYPANDPLVAAQASASRAVRHLRFGEEPGVAVRIERVVVGAEGTDVRLRLPEGAAIAARLASVGAHNAKNAACAAACALALGVPPEAIARGLAAAHPASHRSTVIEIAGRRVIDDCYNASPLSTAAALDTLASLARGSGGRAVAILADMLELGEDEAMLHRNMGERAAALGVDLLIALGERSRETVAGARAAGLVRAHHVDSPAQAARAAIDATAAGDAILVKASRGMRLERVLDELRAIAAAPGAGGEGSA